MSLSYNVTFTTTTSVEPGYCRLFHGILKGSALSIVQFGIDFERIRKYGEGFFWATEDPDAAWSFAELAEQQRMFTDCGPPGQALVGFDISLATMDDLQNREPDPLVWRYVQGYRFSPDCFPILNKQIKNVEITYQE